MGRDLEDDGEGEGEDEGEGENTFLDMGAWDRLSRCGVVWCGVERDREIGGLKGLKREYQRQMEQP
jgi:hypothetical protein